MTMFSEAIPERPSFAALSDEELESKTCEGCLRFGTRTRGPNAGKHFCTGNRLEGTLLPNQKACRHYWDKEEQERLDRQNELDTENRRAELHAIYASKPPVKLPIVYDGYGNIPMCPVCGEMPYDLDQCHWCGQHFLQDDEIKEYAKPLTEKGICFQCGAEVTVRISKYNGHRRYKCETCGCSMIE